MASRPAHHQANEPDGPTFSRGPGVLVPQFARGVLMGAADAVPGVSGGTVALVLGIYRQLIAALRLVIKVVTAVLRGNLRLAADRFRQVPWLWLVGLGSGILGAVFVLSKPITAALAQYPVQMAGLFLGLVLGAVVLCWQTIERVTATTVVLAAVTAVALFALLGVGGGQPAVAANPSLLVYFGAAIVAICAMILPGISGSFLLVLMGMYAPVLGAVADRKWLVLIVFAAGCAVGLALASNVLHWLLERYHDAVVAAMTGLMVGSIRILWPWPGGLNSTTMTLPTADTALVPILAAVGGCVLVLGLDYLGRRVRNRTAADPAGQPGAK